ncbi:hypothetical protein LPMP_080400 [Leishmania panamensis]|uniref:Uncharacterized protein n=1 Tax=Leishmania panamensis TaxID=5679 RepID=A0A088RKZ2_LEIPA|nr:hypothetical protein LPMP_080400 [Leishmania panamensis]AIN95849.1 hypothetical protein LPMP_080400 [Leishmania panamensis]
MHAATLSSLPEDESPVAPVSPPDSNATRTDAAPYPSSSTTHTAAVPSSLSTAEMSNPVASDFARLDATTIVEALLWMSGGKSSGCGWQGPAPHTVEVQADRSSTPLEASVEALKASHQPPPPLLPNSAVLPSTGNESLVCARAYAASEPNAPPAAAATVAPLQRPSSHVPSSSLAPFFQEDAAMTPCEQTPTPRRSDAAHAYRMGRRDDGEGQAHALPCTAPTAGVDSTGLVSSTFASRSSTAAVSRTSPQGGEVLSVTALQRAPSVPRQASAPAAGTDAPGAVSAPRSRAAGTEVGGALWQQAFAVHAQQLLRETQQQVDELRQYQQKAVREAQRADAVAAGYRALEVQLAEADAKRAEERVAHEAAFTELSQQALRLEEAVGVLRRSKLELQRQLKEGQIAAAQQVAEHQRELRELRSAFESHVERMCTEQHRQVDQWRQERQQLEEELAEWKSTGITMSAQQRHMEVHCAKPEHQHRADVATSLHAMSTPACEAEAERTTAVCRVDAATTTDKVNPPAAPTTPQEDNASPYARVHRDVLAQQQLREQTMLSQLSIADARVQQEAKQRRLAEDRVAELLKQSEQLREALANAEIATLNAERASEVVRKHAAAALAGQSPTKRANSNHQRRQRTIVEQDVAYQRQQLLQKIQHEYTALRRERVALVSQHKAQQQRAAERWIAVRSAVSTLLHVVGLHDAQSTLDAANDADTSSLPCIGDVFTESSETSLNGILAALDTLTSALRSQQKAAAADEAAMHEQRRLSALEEALRAAEAQNLAHIASLEATKAQLCESQRELAVWQQRQKGLATRQDAQDAAWRVTALQLKQVTGVVRRALREYAQPLPASLSMLNSARAAAAESADSARRRVVRRRSTRGLKQRSRSTPTSAALLDSAEDSEGDATVSSRGLHHEAFVPGKVPCEGNEDDDTDTIAGAKCGSPPWLLSTSTASLSFSSAATFGITELTDAGGDAGHSGVRRAMAVVSRGLLRLLTTWRTRQHTLVEAHKALQRQVEDAMAQNAALAEGQREAKSRYQQQLRLSRAAEQRRAHQLEHAQQELEDAKRQHVLDSAQARQKASEWESERDVLCRRVRVAEEQVNRAEQALVEADVAHSTQHASHETLQRELSDVTASRDRLERRQADLCVHIEDLEARLLVAERTQAALHALITTSVAFIARLSADHQQLQGHYRVLRTLAQAETQTARMVECVLERNNLRKEEQGSAAVAERRLTWSAGAPSGASAWPAAAAPHSSAPATRLRAVGHAVRAATRLSLLLAARQRLRDNAGTHDSDASFLSPAATAAESAALQPLLLALSSAFTWGAAAPVLNSAVITPHDSLLQRYTTRPDSCVLPVVRLPPPLELVALGYNEDSEVEARGEARGHKARFGCRSGAYENEAAHVSAGHQQRQLVRLLTVAQLDVQAPTTRHLCAEVVAAGSASARATAELLQLVHVRHALSEKLMGPRCQSSLSISQPQSVPPLPDLRPLLPERLAALLQWQLERTTMQACHASESNMLVQRLVQQNEKVVSALQLRTQEYDAASAKVQSLASQLEQLQAERTDRTAVQEKLVEARASLLRERQLRRAAEERLAELALTRLQWLSDQEQYKREVCLLKMELANASMGSTPPAEEGVRALLAVRGDGVVPPLIKSALSIQVGDTTMTDTACHPASPLPRLDPLSGSVMDGSAMYEPDRVHSGHPPAYRSAPLAAEVDWHLNPENVYYCKLPPNGHQHDDRSHAGRHHVGSCDMNVEAPKGNDARGMASPLPALQYRPRISLPTPQDLAESVPPDGTRSASATHGGGGGVWSIHNTGASLWNAQLQPQSSSSATALSSAALSITTRARTRGSELPPAPQPSLPSTHALQLYVPNVVRQREKGPPLQ